MITLAEAADRLGVTTKTLMKLVRNREIEAYKVGGHWRLQEQDITDYLTKVKA